jgi:hypothetical protein
MLNNLLRLLFPAWNFFSEVNEQLFITVQLQPFQKNSSWVKLDLTPSKRDGFFIKSNENLYLYLNSLLSKLGQQLVELKPEANLEKNETYKILVNYLRQRLQNDFNCKEGSLFIFRINIQKNSNESDFLFQSGSLKCKV